jgi:hypothetical protein
VSHPPCPLNFQPEKIYVGLQDQLASFFDRWLVSEYKNRTNPTPLQVGKVVKALSKSHLCVSKEAWGRFAFQVFMEC